MHKKLFNMFLLLVLLPGLAYSVSGQDIPCYQFHDGDSIGYDIGQFRGNPKELADICSKNPKCVAFNTGGWLKFKLNPYPQENTQGWYEKTCLPSGAHKCKQDYENCRVTFCDDSEDGDDDFDFDSEALCKKCDKYLIGCTEPKHEEPNTKDSYDKNGFDKSGFDKSGFNKSGFNKDGFDRNGYDRQGRDKLGFDKYGFDKNSGAQKCKQDYENCRVTFCDDSEDGEDDFDFDSEALCKKCDKYLIGCTEPKREEPKTNDSYDKNGFDKSGFDKSGFNKSGFNKDGFDRNGYDRQGRDKLGFDKYGFDKSGFNKSGFNKNGFDRDGFDRNGYDKYGFDKSGFDKSGFNKNGFDRDGYDRNDRKKDSKNSSDESSSSGSKFYEYVSQKVQKEELSKDDAQLYLIEIGSWFGLSDKDPKKLFRNLSRVAHPDKCLISEKIAEILLDRGFPKQSSDKNCNVIYAIISGLYSHVK